VSEQKFDYVIEGTGLTNSILSASLALAGFKVLHVDKVSSEDYCMNLRFMF